ncbi:hypothetical protein NSK_001470 [Nannochloropsis salina CCMP1776]|uniref:Uncharacterized protein n=1 Tax=Nannochloropsis salina CCMP1776 TaxID=1027361 RepID=A0A4D9D6Y5_9STRA|nr:hypothetical protein NSK_001470 [Nannochloropsis salina CCMP1776]|eukprot:TFJ87136.1 hypothetical protein NSK_001470 [Nannochloropsis salina CCMP1776]
MAFLRQGAHFFTATIRRTRWCSGLGKSLQTQCFSSSLNRLRVPNQPSSLSYGPLSAILYRLFPGPRLIPSDSWVEEFDCLNRNARRGKKANHGKRPVSSVRRKRKTRTFGRKSG